MDDLLLRFGTTVLGGALVSVGAVGYGVWQSLRRREPHRRPALAWTPLGRRLHAVLALMVVAGLGTLAWNSPATALTAAAVLVLSALVRLLLSSGRLRRRRVSRALADFERRHPAEAPDAQRRAFLALRHREWGEELAAQIVADWPVREEFVRWVAELERRLDC